MKKGKMFFAGAAAVMTFVLASCGGAAVEGTWVEPIPGMESRVSHLKVQKYEKYHLHNIDYSLIATVLCQ